MLAHWNFEEQNKVLECSTITTNIALIIVINAKYNYYISNKVLLEECNKEENIVVTGAGTTSCLKRRFLKCLSNVMYLPSH